MFAISEKPPPCPNKGVKERSLDNLFGLGQVVIAFLQLVSEAYFQQSVKLTLRPLAAVVAQRNFSNFDSVLSPTTVDILTMHSRPQKEKRHITVVDN